MAKKNIAARRVRSTPTYAFIDTNIFLDFYRDSNEATLKLLERLKPVKDHVICTYQVEMEFLKNRQSVLVESLEKVKPQATPKLPAIFADSATSKSLRDVTKNANKKTETLKKRIVNLLKNPKQHDIVYQVLEEIFQSKSAHVLTRDMDIRQQIKRKALRRFLLGYPPRKKNDTSIGDALNWEWIVYCGKKLSGKLVIVTRDSDFGVAVKEQYFLNDQLQAEYRNRVGARRRITYTQRLSDALKLLHVQVPEKEIQAESESIKKWAIHDQAKKEDIKKTLDELSEEFVKLWQESEGLYKNGK